MKTFSTKRKAFTLIELLIVIAIIGILFIVLVSKVDFATDKAKATGVQTDFRSFQMAFDTVARENAGFNTFGWDVGDTKRVDFDTALSGYTYTNEAIDKGDKVRNSYDEGDKNLNEIQDAGETFTGRKVYTEVWTGVYTLVKPGTTEYDSGAIAALETAINANLDPKLHITIADNGTISMANGAQDPWDKEYHGAYISAEDGKDRGAIVIYSDGANNIWGSEHAIRNGVVTVSVPNNNKNGKDDYSLVSVYSYVNGYGEVLNATTGFSNNQTSMGGNLGDAISGESGTGSLPTPDLNGAVANSSSPIAYEWSELKTLAQANLSEDELSDTYGIEVGDYKEFNGVKYILVDLGTDNDGDGIQEDGEDYDGFVFMYNTGTSLAMNESNTNAGGYKSSAMKLYVDDGDDTNNVDLYDKLDPSLKPFLKKVTITCNSGQRNAAGAGDNGMSVYTHDCHLFLASSKEVGFSLSDYQYAAEGLVFDYFSAGTDTVRVKFASSDMANISSTWWMRSAHSGYSNRFYIVNTVGGSNYNVASYANVVVPAFVIG